MALQSFPAQERAEPLLKAILGKRLPNVQSPSLPSNEKLSSVQPPPGRDIHYSRGVQRFMRDGECTRCALASLGVAGSPLSLTGLVPAHEGSDVEGSRSIASDVRVILREGMQTGS